jgi:hypothetical protein
MRWTGPLACCVLLLLLTQRVFAGGHAGEGAGESGWTALTPSADSRIVYVSSAGDDRTGRVYSASAVGGDPTAPSAEPSAFATLAAACAHVRDRSPDWVLLRRGDTLRDTFPDWKRSGRSASEPIVIGAYGVGERPILRHGSPGFRIENDTDSAVAHIVIADLDMSPASYSGYSGGDDASCIYLHWNARDILVEGVRCAGFSCNIIITGDPAGRHASDIRLRRCVLVDAKKLTQKEHPQNLYAAACAGLLLEECVFDWGADNPSPPTIFRHNVYIQGDCRAVVARGCIDARGWTSWEQRPGGTHEKCLHLDNSQHLVMGGLGSEPSVCRYNVCLGSHDILRGSNPLGEGIQIAGDGKGVRGFEVYENICAGAGAVTSTENIYAYSTENHIAQATVRDNIAWKWVNGAGHGGCLFIGGAPTPGGITYRSNDFQQPGGGRLIEDHAHAPAAFISNRYHSSDSSMFATAGKAQGLREWRSSHPGEDQTSLVRATYPDPDRSITTYAASIGLEPTLGAFMDAARANRKGTWNPAHTAAPVIDYIRAGFGRAAAP